jgi:hypothetical protein
MKLDRKKIGPEGGNCLKKLFNSGPFLVVIMKLWDVELWMHLLLR